MTFIIACLLSLLTCGFNQAWADGQPTHGLARHGEVKYKKGFHAFDSVNPDAPKGGEISIPVVGRVFDSLNPFVLTGKPAEGLGFYHYLPFDQLMTRSPDEPFSTYGRLVERVSLAPNHSKIIFYLRKKARFHDGTPVTAEDVKFTFELFREKGTPSRRMIYRRVEGIRIIDPHTIEFTFKETNGKYDQELPVIIGAMPVLSKKDLEGKDFENSGLTPLMGSGPYRIKAFEPGKFITYERDPNYWGKDLPINRGSYNFDKITYQYYGTDIVCFQAFKAGEVHSWQETDFLRWKKEYDDLPAIKQKKMTREIVPFRDAAVCTFFVMNMRRPLFKDIKVRQALTHMYDFEWVNRHLFHGGYSRKNGSIFGTTELAATDPIPSQEEQEILASLNTKVPHAFDPLPKLPTTDGSGNIRPQMKQALALLKDAGWELSGGVMKHKKTGEQFQFEILTQDPKNEKIIQAFARNLRRIGIQAHIRIIDSANYQDRLRSFDFDMIMHPYGHSLSPGAEQRLYWSPAMADVPSRNYAGIKSPAIDELCELLLTAKDRKDLVLTARCLDRVLQHECVMIPLYQKVDERIAYWSFLKHPTFNGINVPSPYTWWSVAEKK